MKRLGLVFMVAVVVMGMTTKASARTGAWHYYDGAYRWVDYGHTYGHYRIRPVVQVGVGYGYGYGCGYDYGYSRGPAGYPDRSLFDFLTGETDRKALGILEKDQDFRQEQERRAEDKEILARAAQRGRDQKLEDENRKLRERVAELEKKIDKLLAARPGK